MFNINPLISITSSESLRSLESWASLHTWQILQTWSQVKCYEDLAIRLSSIQINFFKSLNQKEPKLNLFWLIFGLFHSTKQKFRLVIRKQQKQTLQFRNVNLVNEEATAYCCMYITQSLSELEFCFFMIVVACNKTLLLYESSGLQQSFTSW
jgi:hypothetical protein